MSKYEPLWIYLKKQNQDNYELTFAEIEKILNFPIDHSFLRYKKELKKIWLWNNKNKIKRKNCINKKYLKWNILDY